jgi:hypothetical protein
MGDVPLHVPVELVSIWPTAELPEIDGGIDHVGATATAFEIVTLTLALAEVPLPTGYAVAVNVCEPFASAVVSRPPTPPP